MWQKRTVQNFNKNENLFMCNKWFNDEIFQSSSGGANLQPATWQLALANDLQSTVNASREYTSWHAQALSHCICMPCLCTLQSTLIITLSQWHPYDVSSSSNCREPPVLSGLLHATHTRLQPATPTELNLCITCRHLPPASAAFTSNTRRTGSVSYSLTISKLGKSRHS